MLSRLSPRVWILPARRVPEMLAAALAGVERVLVVEQSHGRQFQRYLRAFYDIDAEIASLARPGPLPITNTSYRSAMLPPIRKLLEWTERTLLYAIVKRRQITGRHTGQCRWTTCRTTLPGSAAGQCYLALDFLVYR